MSAHIELKAITEENFIDAFNLRLAPGQEDFVSHPIRSLAQAYVYRDQCQPFGIYANGKMVGYVMVTGKRVRQCSPGPGDRIHRDKTVRRFGKGCTDLQQE